MPNPNTSVHYLPDPLPANLTKQWKKYIIQAATPNDTKLSFSLEQKNLIPKVDMTSYDFPSYPKPNTTKDSITYSSSTDICFYKTMSPEFNLWVEKVKICLHQPATYGCIKVNVWNF